MVYIGLDDDSHVGSGSGRGMLFAACNNYVLMLSMTVHAATNVETKYRSIYISSGIHRS